MAVGLTASAAFIVQARRSRPTSARCSLCSRWPEHAAASVNSGSGRAVMSWFDARRARARARGTADRDADRRLRRCAGSSADRRSAESPRTRSSSSQRSCFGGALVGGLVLRSSASTRRSSKSSAALDAPRPTALGRLSLASGLYVVRPARAHSGFVSPLPARRARLFDSRRRARGRRVAGHRDGAPHRCRPLVRRRRLTRSAPSAHRDRDRGRARCGRRASGADASGSSCPRSRSPAVCPWPGTGFPFTTAAEIGGSSSGAAIGMQQTALGGGGHRLVPVVVRSCSSRRPRGRWRFCFAAVFPLAGVLTLLTARRPLVSRACDSSIGSTSSTRSAAGRARTGRTLSAAEDDAHDLAARWLVEAGLDVEVDRHGNLFGLPDHRVPWKGVRHRSDACWVGSHLDTVPQGGRFDGALGVVAAIDAVERMGAGTVVVFRGEEVGCIGSRALVAAGDPLPRRVPRAPRRAGPHACRAAALRSGSSPSIVGYARAELFLEGCAGHAGTTPMAGRADALVRPRRRSSAIAMPPSRSRTPWRRSASSTSSRAART